MLSPQSVRPPLHLGVLAVALPLLGFGYAFLFAGPARMASVACLLVGLSLSIRCTVRGMEDKQKLLLAFGVIGILLSVGSMAAILFMHYMLSLAVAV